MNSTLPMKQYGRPKVIVTDRLRSYQAALNVIGNATKQECGGWLNNRTEGIVTLTGTKINQRNIWRVQSDIVRNVSS